MACRIVVKFTVVYWGSRLKDYEPRSTRLGPNLEQILKTQHSEGSYDNKQIRLPKEDALEIVDDLIKNFPNIEKIDFAGGEVHKKQFQSC